VVVYVVVLVVSCVVLLRCCSCRAVCCVIRVVCFVCDLFLFSQTLDYKKISDSMTKPAFMENRLGVSPKKN